MTKILQIIPAPPNLVAVFEAEWVTDPRSDKYQKVLKLSYEDAALMNHVELLDCACLALTERGNEREVVPMVLMDGDVVLINETECLTVCLRGSPEIAKLNQEICESLKNSNE